ncbi:MAG: hypothetical protein K0R82_1957 [Flavipsychrobacter sp.]|jgi:hypothetical protein|nr:hypothetical protein [Flavipsychrobacter sp.]
MKSSGPIYKYVNYILIATALATLYFIGIWDTDLGDYTKQINQLSATGTLIVNGQLNNRYPPVTSFVYFTAFKIFGFAGKAVAILLLHTAFALLIQLGFELLLKHYGYKASTLLKQLATTIVIFNPFILSFMVRGVNSELIFICCSLFALWFALRNNKVSNLLAAGLLTGIAILTRMQGLALLLSICLLVFLSHRKLVQPALFLLAAILTIAPWQYINSKYGSGFIASGGLPGFRDGLSFNNKKYREPIDLPNKVAVLSDSFYHIYYTLKERAHVEPAEDEISFVKKYLSDNPGTGVALFWLKLKRSFYGTDSQNHKIELVNRLLVGTILLGSLISGILLLRKRSKPYNLLLLWILIYSCLTMGMSIIALSILRYQAPLIPFLFLVCFIGIEKAFSRSSPVVTAHKKPMQTAG